MELLSSGRCWEGKHTTSSVDEKDLRRFLGRHPLPLTGDILQEEVDVLASSAVVLTVQESWTTLYLGREFLRLEELVLEDLPFLDTLFIGDELFPKLRELTLIALPVHCTYTFNTSSLKVLNLGNGDWKGGRNGVQDFVEGSTALEALNAPGLDVVDLVIASNTLTRLYLRYAERIDNLTLWAPNLEALDVQSCYVGDFVWLQEHALKKDLPAEHVRPHLSVFIHNSNILGDKFVSDGKRMRISCYVYSW